MRLRLGIVLASAWLAGSIAIWVVASENFRKVDAVLSPGYRAELAALVAPRSLAEERPILRFLASELNRSLFRVWGRSELVLAVLLGLVLLGEPGLGVAPKLLAVLLALTSGLLALWLAPALQRLGPPLDFVPRPLPAEWLAPHAAFLRAHGVFMAIDLGKVVLLGALLVLLLRARSGSRYGEALGPAG